MLMSLVSFFHTSVPPKPSSLPGSQRSQLLVDEFPHGLNEQTGHRSRSRLKLQLSAAQFLGSFACGRSQRNSSRSSSQVFQMKKLDIMKYVQSTTKRCTSYIIYNMISWKRTSKAIASWHLKVDRIQKFSGDTLDWHAPLRTKPHLFLLSVGHALPSCNLLSLTLVSWAYGDVVRSERSLNSNVGERRGWLSDTLGREGGRRKDRRWPGLDPKWHRVSSSIEHPPSTCTMHKSWILLTDTLH